MPHHDNNSTTDCSSITSALEHDNVSSDDFVKIDAGGLVGFLERMPMWLKLLIMIVIGSVIMFSFAGWLAGVQGSIAIASIQDRHVLMKFLVAGGLSNALQNERGAALLFSVAPTEGNGNNLKHLIVDTDSKLAEFISNPWYQEGSLVAQKIGMLPRVRNGVQAQQEDSLSIFQWYTTAIAMLSDFIVEKSKEIQKQHVISIEHLFLKLKNAEEQLWSFGLLVLGNKNSSLSDYFQDTFKELSATRNTLANIWLDEAPTEQIDLFNKTILLIPEYATATAMMKKIAHGNPSILSLSSIDIDAWNGNMTIVHNLYDTALLTLFEQADYSAYMYFAIQTCAHFTIIIVLGIVCIVLYALISFCFSRTIIGPWVRMNKLQEAVTYKFVPRGLLRMIGCNNITQVKVGKYSTKQVVLMKIAIRDYWQQIESLSVDNRVLYTNRFFNAINPLLTSYGGYIDTMKPDELQICFKTPGSAVICANKIHHLIKAMNAGDFAPLNITIAIHAAPYADLAIVGDPDRIQGVVISKLQQEARQILHIAKKFHCKTVVSSNVMGMLKEKIEGGNLIAMIDGKSPFVLYEFMSSMNKSEREQFSKAVRDVFVDYNFVAALSNLRTNESEAAKFYSKVCTQVLEQCKAQVASLTVEEILNEPSLEEIVNQVCNKERSMENLEIFKSIKRFKMAWVTPNLEVQRECVSFIKDQIDQVNCTDTLKHSLQEQLAEQQSWNENMFQALECEILLLLTDTVKRLKISDQFRNAYIKGKGMKSDLLLERFEDC